MCRVHSLWEWECRLATDGKIAQLVAVVRTGWSAERHGRFPSVRICERTVHSRTYRREVFNRISFVMVEAIRNEVLATRCPSFRQLITTQHAVDRSRLIRVAGERPYHHRQAPDGYLRRTLHSCECAQPVLLRRGMVRGSDDTHRQRSGLRRKAARQPLITRREEAYIALTQLLVSTTFSQGPYRHDLPHHCHLLAPTARRR
jgi:hypothetical protein